MTNARKGIRMVARPVPTPWYPWDEQKEGQVPQAPEHSQEERSHQRTRALLQVWECKATPASFLPQWSPKDKCRQVDDQVGQPEGEVWQAKGGEGSWLDQGGEQQQGRDAQQNQQ